MEHDHLRDLLKQYVAGVVSDDERELVQRHLDTGCATCLQELTELSMAAESMLDLADLEQPPRRLKESVLARIDAASTPKSETQPPRPPSTTGEDRRAAANNLVKLAGVAAALAACMLLAVASWWYNSVVQQREQMAAESLEAMRAMQRRIAQTETILDTSRFHTIGLNLTPKSGGPVNRILYDGLSGELHLWIAAVPDVQDFEAVRIVDPDGNVIAQKQLSGDAKYRHAVVPLGKLPPQGKLELGNLVGPNRAASDEDQDFAAQQTIEFSVPSAD